MSDRPKPSARAPLGIRLHPAAWFIVVALAIYFFGPVSTVFLGMLAAIIIACALHPLMAYIPGPRGVDVAVLGVGLIGIVALAVFALSWPLAAPIAEAVDSWPQTREHINVLLAHWSDRVGLQQPPTVEKFLHDLGDFLAGEGGQRLFSRSTDVVFGLMVSLVLTLVGSIFLLADPPQQLLRPALRLFSARNRLIMEAVIEDLAPRFRKWVVGTLTGMLVVFIASALGYRIIGLKLAIPLALIAGMAEIVPTVGPAVAAVVAAVVAAATQSSAKAAAVFAVWGVIQALEAYIILPRIMKGAVNIHPAITLFSVVLWGKVFGVPGLMLAIPINLTIWSLLEHFRIRPREELDRAEASGRASG